MINIKFTLVCLGIVIGLLSLDSPSKAAQRELGKNTVVGGYFDTEYHALNNGTRKFMAHRFILNTSSQVHDRVSVYSEIEFEYGGKMSAGDAKQYEGELKFEQAWADFELNHDHSLRAGIVLVPFGIVNIKHDSDMRDATNRPIYAKYIVPTTWMDTGVGAHGSVDVGDNELTYEAYMVNGLTSSMNISQGIRSARPNFKSDNNNNAALMGRLGYSPTLGLTFGTSVYSGKYSNDGTKGLTLYGLDVFWKKGPFEVLGEWAKADIDSINNMDGYYVEGRYHFFPAFLKDTLLGTGFANPTFTLFSRYSAVDLDSDVSGTDDKAQLTLGVNYRPIPTVVFKVEGELLRANGDSLNTSGIVSSIAVGF